MEQKDYSQYEVQDFVTDSRFINWIKKATSEEDAFWKAWLQVHPERQSVVEEARQLVQHLTFKEDHLPRESLQRIKHYLDEVYDAWSGQSASDAVSSPSSGRSFWTKSTYRVAAVITFLLLASGVLWIALPERKPTYTTYTTGFGQTQVLVLPDGSQVALNANTKLRLASSWLDGDTREVWLNGEAFFVIRKKTVVKDKKTTNVRFVVHTGQANVEVLGTEFNVCNRRGQTVVVLNEGKVKLANPLQPQAPAVVMEPGEYAQLSGTSRGVMRRKVNPEQYSSWTDNRYVFDDTALQDIALMLEDTYGLQVVFKTPALAERTFSATIPSKDLDTLLLALSEAFSITVERQGNQLLLKEKYNEE